MFIRSMLCKRGEYYHKKNDPVVSVGIDKKIAPDGYLTIAQNVFRCFGKIRRGLCA